MSSEWTYLTMSSIPHELRSKVAGADHPEQGVDREDGDQTRRTMFFLAKRAPMSAAVRNTIA